MDSDLFQAAPTTTCPRRRPGSLRRTTTADGVRRHGLLQELEIVGRARDLLTHVDGRAEVIGTAELMVVVDFLPDRLIRSVATRPPTAGLDALVGRRATNGFRLALQLASPERHEDGSLAAALLEDIPNVTMLSRLVLLRNAAPRELLGVSRVPPVDICAGIASDTSLGRAAVAGREPAQQLDMAAPELDDLGDELAWHATPEVPILRFRRVRRLDIDLPTRVQPSIVVSSWFRDTVRDRDGTEVVIHEYSVQAEIEAATQRVVACRALPHVLPVLGCARAAASAEWLIGLTLPEIHRRVRDQFEGVKTCTHLNEQLRAMGDTHQAVRQALHLLGREEWTE